MKPPRYGMNICPRCGIRERQTGKTYCPECTREYYRESKRKKRSATFATLMREARECRESVKYLRKMGEVGRVQE